MFFPLHRHVYTSVCNQHSAIIYADLLSLLCEQLAKFSDDLEVTIGSFIPQEIIIYVSKISLNHHKIVDQH